MIDLNDTILQTWSYLGYWWIALYTSIVISGYAWMWYREQPRPVISVWDTYSNLFPGAQNMGYSYMGGTMFDDEDEMFFDLGHETAMEKLAELRVVDHPVDADDEQWFI